MRDPYSMAVAFDDLPQYAGAGDELDDVTSAASAVLRHARKRRRRRASNTPVELIGVDYDPTYLSFETAGVAYRIIGADANDNTTPPLPLLDSLHQDFSASMPQTRLVRLDDPSSYADFRSARRAPYIEDLERRIAALEDAADDHEQRDSEAHQAIADMVQRACRGGDAIDLPVKPRGVDCWRDDDEILVTVFLVGPLGQPLMATTGDKVEKGVEEVVGCSERLGIGPHRIAPAALHLAEVIGVSDALSQLCSVVGAVVKKSGGHPHVTAVVPKTDAKVAATMALMQRAQQGDRRALQEATQLVWSNPGLLLHASNQLARGQLDKLKAAR
jgi:hypothetical protein